ncbi:hypothetical protein IV203_023115 [Nitzschia inconspicua]|uniref:Mitochondrial splicing suppressor 51-like C-terminal domain-containing protein n=1 Tax=Nitzschia inconspicua TaxID=303405 RepID=A0A9K3KCE5_9STRA|nr:hypothetical protein IV203_023115 [Nitzschia inconspicua]
MPTSGCWIATACPFSTKVTVNNNIISRSTQPSFQDPTLMWAQSNPILAKDVLDPPTLCPTKIIHENLDRNIQKPTSLEEYLHSRQWLQRAKVILNNDDDDDDDDLEHAKNLISHVLSSPLTIGSQLSCRFRRKENDQSLMKKWCCVGARAEASLPTQYWQECLLSLVMAAGGTSQEGNILLEFTGPDLPPNNIPNANVTVGSWNIATRGGFRGLYHDASLTATWDAIILLNPGLAHPNLQSSWQLTLDMIFRNDHQQPPRQILLTAHSAKDADRDAKLLRHKYGLTVEYNVNPFASRIRYQDPFDLDHFVQPNLYVAVVEVG